MARRSRSLTLSLQARYWIMVAIRLLSIVITLADLARQGSEAAERLDRLPQTLGALLQRFHA